MPKHTLPHLLVCRRHDAINTDTDDYTDYSKQVNRRTCFSVIPLNELLDTQFQNNIIQTNLVCNNVKYVATVSRNSRCHIYLDPSPFCHRETSILSQTSFAVRQNEQRTWKMSSTWRSRKRRFGRMFAVLGLHTGASQIGCV